MNCFLSIFKKGKKQNEKEMGYFLSICFLSNEEAARRKEVIITIKSILSIVIK